MHEGMKGNTAAVEFGVNTFVWVSPLSTAAVKVLAPKVKSMGFDILELAVEKPELIDVNAVSEVLSDVGLGAVVCGAWGPDRNISSSDAGAVAASNTYVHWLVDAAAELGSSTVCGPMYSGVGKTHLDDKDARKAEWARAVEGVREMAAYAAGKGVRLALEPLNRFETDMINVASQGLDFIDQVAMENVGLHLDTFHMHLEEKDSSDAIRRASDKIYHFHACENDRGVPGTGQVHWPEIASALKAVKYGGPVVIESFASEVREIARAVCIWREIAPSQDAIASEGLQFLKSILA
jgi:D-psicose/D-tagatose/L-ribulose 3-epimerase